MSNRQGRPKGAKNITDVVYVPPVMCPNCKTTDHTEENFRSMDMTGSGYHCSKVVWFTWCCKHCTFKRRIRTEEHSLKEYNRNTVITSPEVA